jgi:hypothetical protein
MHAIRPALFCTALCLLGPPSSAADWFGKTVAGNGNFVTQTRTVSGYQAIALQGMIQVVLRQSGHEGVEVRADENLHEAIETRVVQGRKGPTLEVRPKEGKRISSKNPVVVVVDFATLHTLTLGGAVDVSGSGLKADSIAIDMGGACAVRLPELQADEVRVSIGGSGGFEASGHGHKLLVDIAGSGHVSTEAFDADDVSVDVSGAGVARVKANKTLNVSVAGAGDVIYSGDAVVTKSIAGAGSVKKR